MPAPDPSQLGPLAGLAGTWEGDQGLDVSYHHAEGAIGETAYRERVEFKPFGPVGNGTQELFGLDYRMAAYRQGEDEPFHTEVGYWLWCSDSRTVMRAFMVPRGTVVLAAGTAEPDAREFTLTAELGDPVYGILENKYLSTNASTVRYECVVSVGDGEFTYDEVSVLKMKEFDELFNHTDKNALRRVD
jgi:hypothetical protein